MRQINPHFIAFDGLNGCGKSTHIKLLAPWLEENILPKLEGADGITLVKDPARVGAAAPITRILKERWVFLSKAAKLQLFLAARSLLSEEIEIFLGADNLVISDRWEPSTWAYQKFGDGHDLGIDDISPKDCVQPGLTIILTIPPELSQQRLRKRISNGTADEHTGYISDLTYINRVYDGFFDYGSANFRFIGETHYLSALGSIEETQAKIRQVVAEYLQSL